MVAVSDDDFPEKGFLSANIGPLIAEIRSGSEEWFALADDLSGCLQRLGISRADQIRGTSFDRGTVAQMLLFRSCGNLQGAILMAERGMVVEARTLTRSLLENTFVMAALLSRPQEILDMLEEDAAAARKGQANALLKSDLPVADAENLKVLVAALGKVRNLTPTDASDLGPLKQLYLLYRVLSNDSAHPSAKSLARHLSISDDGSSWSGFLIGAASDQPIRDTLQHLLASAISLGVAFTEIVGDAEANAELAEIAERYRVLVTNQRISEPGVVVTSA